jgi:hypothetical protein
MKRQSKGLAFGSFLFGCFVACWKERNRERKKRKKKSSFFFFLVDSEAPPSIPPTPADEIGRAMHRQLLAFVLDDRQESIRIACDEFVVLCPPLAVHHDCF